MLCILSAMVNFYSTLNVRIVRRVPLCLSPALFLSFKRHGHLHLISLFLCELSKAFPCCSVVFRETVMYVWEAFINLGAVKYGEADICARGPVRTYQMY